MISRIFNFDKSELDRVKYSFGTEIATSPEYAPIALAMNRQVPL